MAEVIAWSTATVALLWLAIAAPALRQRPLGNESNVKRPRSWLQLVPGITYPILATSGIAALLLDVGTYQPGPAATALQAIGLTTTIAATVLWMRARVEMGDEYAADARTWTEQRLLTRGLFGLVRHPIYLGTIGIWLGTGLGIRSWAMLAIGLAVVVPALRARAGLEERVLWERFGSQYSRYCAQVPMLSPWPRPNGSPGESQLPELPGQPPVPEQE
jgi:protein-S-isoprenylcysteine O-methyltransferase Ste14